MITNPQIGMRVKSILTSWDRSITGRQGIIQRIDNGMGNMSIRVQFDDWYLWWCKPSDLELLVLTPEEQDQQNRLEHAMKYL